MKKPYYNQFERMLILDNKSLFGNVANLKIALHRCKKELKKTKTFKFLELTLIKIDKKISKWLNY